jgi:hypothetical protein
MSNFDDGSKDVAVAGTPERLSDVSIPCAEVTIVAKVANTDLIYVGGASVSSASGVPLNGGDAQTIKSYRNVDLANIWIDAAVNGEGVTFNYTKS